MFCIVFSKGFFWSHLTIFTRLQTKRHAEDPEKESYSALIRSHVRTSLVKNENGTVSLPRFMIIFPHVSKLVHRVFWEDVFPNETVLLLSMSIHYNSFWSGQDARDTWCSGNKAQFAGSRLSAQHCFNFLFSMLLAGERKRVWWYNRGYDSILSLSSCIMLTRKTQSTK